MFSLRFTIVLLAILVLPFVLRWKYRLEPYPAVLLPSGASKVPVATDEIEVKYTGVYAINKDGTWGRVNAVRLLYPIPIQYLNPILLRGFGLKDAPRRIYNSALLHLLVKVKVLKTREITKRDEEEVKSWLRRKLKEQGFSVSMLKIVERQETVSVPGGETLSEKDVDEEVLYLD